ncbi:NUDIX domain-containing protein [Candidatus Falkowbacteria bacterium]|nr:NUDIX domain-containing protein [Candidatus Falkowbacteria bacterium]
MMMTKYPTVDDDDNIIGETSKDEAYNKGLQLRSVQIFLFDKEGRIFIQKRSHKKKRFPDYFCASVAGHVEPYESYLSAARRELKEELGVDGEIKFLTTEKTPIGSGQFAMMAHFIARTSEAISLQAEEITSGEFYTIREIEDLIKGGSQFTPSFLYYFDKIKKGNLEI